MLYLKRRDNRDEKDAVPRGEKESQFELSEAD